MFVQGRVLKQGQPRTPRRAVFGHLLPNATCTDGPIWLPASEWICTYIFGQVYLNLCTEVSAWVMLTRSSVVCALEMRGEDGLAKAANRYYRCNSTFLMFSLCTKSECVWIKLAKKTPKI